MTRISNTPYSALEVGQKASYEKTVDERDIQLFAAMSGDRNPVHLDAEYAAGTLFKERIAHGMFSGALISAAVACTLPGPGTIYLGQTMKFTRPVKLGDTLVVRLEILEKLPKNRVRVATQVYNQNEEIVVDGEAKCWPRASRKSSNSRSCHRSASADPAGGKTAKLRGSLRTGCAAARARAKNRRQKKGDLRSPKCLACSVSAGQLRFFFESRQMK